jgi:hypothetical protein
MVDGTNVEEFFPAYVTVKKILPVRFCNFTFVSSRADPQALLM